MVRPGARISSDFKCLGSTETLGGRFDVELAVVASASTPHRRAAEAPGEALAASHITAIAGGAGNPAGHKLCKPPGRVLAARRALREGGRWSGGGRVRPRSRACRSSLAAAAPSSAPARASMRRRSDRASSAGRPAPASPGARCRASMQMLLWEQ